MCIRDRVIHARVMNELPFMATENILMRAVKKGGDRQALHERLRVHAQAAARVVKEEGRPNDLLDRVGGDPAFGLTSDEVHAVLEPKAYIGLAEEQVEHFLATVIDPVLEQNKGEIGEGYQLSV